MYQYRPFFAPQNSSYHFFFMKLGLKFLFTSDSKCFHSGIWLKVMNPYLIYGTLSCHPPRTDLRNPCLSWMILYAEPGLIRREHVTSSMLIINAHQFVRIIFQTCWIFKSVAKVDERPALSSCFMLVWAFLNFPIH